MIHKVIAAIAALLAASAFASVDVNRASQAELESVKGIGPAVSTRILGERRKGGFQNWDDLVARVQGVGAGSAATFSQGGLTVDGKAYAGASTAATAAGTAKAARATKASKPAARPRRDGGAVREGSAGSATKAADPVAAGPVRK